MKITRKLGYNNYGMYPRNEYTKANEEGDANAAVMLNEEPQAPEDALEQPALRRRLHFQSGPWNRDWLRSRSTSGWRAKAAAEQHEDVHT